MAVLSSGLWFRERRSDAIKLVVEGEGYRTSPDTELSYDVDTIPCEGRAGDISNMCVETS